MNGVEKALSKIDVINSVGVEVGPLARPLVRREQGQIFYIDRLSTDQLREHYKDQNIDIGAIVDVDYVWGEKTLPQCVEGSHFDYCVAAHVVEHVPDLVGWLNEIEEILRPGGILSLIVPDSRYSFDARRPLATMSDVIGAFASKQRRPSPRQVFDHFAYHIHADAHALWAGASPASFPFVHDTKFALNAATQSVGAYVDVHCWVLTPRLFVSLLEQLRLLGLTSFEVATLFETDRDSAEFFVSLRRGN